MLTNKGKYGLKAMVHLAGLPEGDVAQAPVIAEACNMSKKFLDQILSELRNAHLVYSKKGKAGGYALAKPAEEIFASATLFAPSTDRSRRSPAQASPPTGHATTAATKSFARCG